MHACVSHHPPAVSRTAIIPNEPQQTLNHSTIQTHCSHINPCIVSLVQMACGAPGRASPGGSTSTTAPTRGSATAPAPRRPTCRGRPPPSTPAARCAHRRGWTVHCLLNVLQKCVNIVITMYTHIWDRKNSAVFQHQTYSDITRLKVQCVIFQYVCKNRGVAGLLLLASW